MSGPILNFVQKIYASLMAQLVIPGFMSWSIPLTKGTRRGFPLFPLLFNITIEPLFRILDSASGISSVKIDNQTFRLTLFADNIWLFFTDPPSDCSKLQDLFVTFRVFYGQIILQIIFDKCKVSVLNLSVSSRWSTLSPFLIAKQYITYLGIRIGREPSSLYSLILH